MLVLARKNQVSVVIAYSGDLRELGASDRGRYHRWKGETGFQACNDLTTHRVEGWERVCGEFAESTPELAVERTKYRVPYID